MTAPPATPARPVDPLRAEHGAAHGAANRAAPRDAPHIAPTHAGGGGAGDVGSGGGPDGARAAEDPALFHAVAPKAQGRTWRPRRVLVTRSARDLPLARRTIARADAMGAEIVELKGDQIRGLTGGTAAETYRLAKSTLAIVVASPSKMRPQPIPPSADWRFDLATGCPAHCQYCYLAGSLKGPPVTRLHANLPDILAGLAPFVGEGTVTSRSAERAGEGTTFEASCYTDPLGIEPVTGALSDAVAHFGAWREDVQLRFTTKYDGVEPLLGIAHRGRTRARFSVNAEPVTRRFEGGTAKLADRLAAMGRMAEAGYPVGLTIAPIMPIEDWREHYGALVAGAARALSRVNRPDVTAELITHRFTPGSKEVLLGWYPATSLEMDERVRARKRTKFGSLKYVYPAALMREMREAVEGMLARDLPDARVLYWT